ncbi:unnamed protein product [Urochloa decumbens]|uniref:Uncharacterized protein n=1 Tax=Urochloa decumbens TaxID=240449 RepID=A0ABC9BVA7_9POAL
MDDASSNVATRTISIHGGRPTTQEIVLDIEERTARANERLKAEFSMADTKIHRFPRGMQRIGGDDERYIVPSVVAIGPYHHGLPHLQKMDEVKLAATYQLCTGSGWSTMEVYEKVLSVAGDARGCYDADDPSLAGLSDARLGAMMFLDGYFLLQYMAGGGTEPVPKSRITLSTGEFMPNDVDVPRFVARVQQEFHPGGGKAKVLGDSGVSIGNGYTPSHLLGLLWFTLVGSMPAHVMNYTGFVLSTKSSSAMELAQIGVRLTPSKEPWFGDISVRRRHLYGFGEMSLSPVFLNDVTACCWLVNMAALEASVVGGSRSRESDGYVTLGFFKSLAQDLRFGNRYLAILEAIHSYQSTMSVCKATYKFVYNNYRAIAAVLSVAGVLVGIFRALYSLKQHC